MKKTTMMLVAATVGAIIVIAIFTFIFKGGAGLWSAIKWFFLIAIILGIIAALIFAAFWLFSKKKIDLVQVHKDRIIKACKLNAVPYKQKLAMRSQGDDWAGRTLGNVIGLCMIKHAPKMDKKGEDYDETLVVTQKTWQDLIFIAFRPPGILNNIFSITEVVGGTREDYSRLSGDTIYMNGMTFAPEIYNILFLSHHWEHRHIIDETISGNIYRYTIEQFLKELATMMEDAIDTSPRHKKEQEKANIQQFAVPRIPQQPQQ